MLAVLAGRLLTSPVAFVAAGLIDFAGFWAVWAWHRWRPGRDCQFRLRRDVAARRRPS